jgi:hypothetical protein
MPRVFNFDLAFARVRDELVDQPKSGRTFVADTFEMDLAAVDLESWLEALESDVTTGKYTPGAMELCGAPKGGDLIRPGAHVALSDRVVYTAAVGACLKHIVRQTKWSQRKIDCSPLFPLRNWHQRRWLLKPFLGWERWMDRSLELLDRRTTKFVVTVDIAGFFENISIGRLRSDLNRIDSPPEAVDLITLCLNKWALVPDRSLPQGVLASDILAKLYLESLDKRLKDAGHTHLRYADDIRVFCRSRAEARRALVLVTELLRERALTLQSAKSAIRDADGALRQEFEGAVPLIKALNRDFIDEAIDAGILPVDEASVPVSVIDDLINAEPQAMDPEVIRRAFKQYVLDARSPNQSMLRYLLRRFAAIESDHAVDYASSRIRSNPESAPEILRYFADLEDPRSLEVPVAAALSSSELEPYPYSRFLLLGWLRRNSRTLRKPTLRAVRKQAFQPEHPDYVRTAAFAVLGHAGEHSDLDQIAALLASTQNPLHRAQLMLCLRTLERSRRNALLGRVGRELPWGPRVKLLLR